MWLPSARHSSLPRHSPVRTPRHRGVFYCLVARGIPPGDSMTSARVMRSHPTDGTPRLHSGVPYAVAALLGASNRQLDTAILRAPFSRRVRAHRTGFAVAMSRDELRFDTLRDHVLHDGVSA